MCLWVNTVALNTCQCPSVVVWTKLQTLETQHKLGINYYNTSWASALAEMVSMLSEMPCWDGVLKTWARWAAHQQQNKGKHVCNVDATGWVTWRESGQATATRTNQSDRLAAESTEEREARLQWMHNRVAAKSAEERERDSKWEL